MKCFVAFFTIIAVTYGNVLRLDDRIVGGELVEISDYPYQASVRIYDQHICGGAILNATSILTACHCVDGMNPSQLSVRVGNNINLLGTKYIVAQVTQNMNYSPRTNDYDLAILRLSKPITFGNNVQPVQLQSQGEEVPAGTTAYVSGWGVTEESSPITRVRLRAVDVSVIASVVCQEKYGNTEISPNMLCAQTIGHDACQGDSGGPLVAGGRLIGIVSWAFGCARPEYPGVYAKVSQMYSWITENKY